MNYTYDNKQNLKFADLHTHTTVSGGTFTPGELVKYASSLGVSVLSITDHDSVSGIDEAIEVGFKAGVEIIPGIELNTDLKDAELHILGYFMDYKNPDFVKKLNFFRDSRIERMRRMIAKLKDNGYHILLEDVCEEAFNDKNVLTGDASMGRPHLARVMVKKKIVEDERAAFERYIGNGKSCYVEVLNKLTPVDAIKFVLEFGGVPIMAHPGLSQRDDMIENFVQEGLCGLEVFHSSHDAEAIKHYEKMAGDLKILMTGGSDCHGPKRDSPPYCGSVRLPLFRIDELKRKREELNK